MIAVVLGAVRARSAQVLAILALSVFITAAAVAAPWFGLAAAGRAGATAIATAPAEQRTLMLSRPSGSRGDPAAELDELTRDVTAVLPAAGGGDGPVRGIRQAITRTGAAPGSAVVVLGYREAFCRHVQLTGACPARAGEVAAGARSGLRIGDVLRVTVVSADPVTLRVVGTYEVTDPAGGYWSSPLFRSPDLPDAFFTAVDTFAAPQFDQPTLVYDLPLPAEQLRAGDLGTVLARAGSRLAGAGVQLVDRTGPVRAVLAEDRAAIRTGVLVALAEVLLLGWFAIGLTARYTGRDRRTDAALLKLRGSTRRRMLQLSVGQHLVPLLGGVLLGAPLGFAAARLLAGPVTGAATVRQAVLLSAATALAGLVGALLVLLGMEVAVLRQPVAVLLRRTTRGRRDWRAGMVDLCLVASAAAAVYHARTAGPSSGLARFAPALAAAAVAVLLVRLLFALAERAGSVALRRGRLGLGLTAVQAIRQPGTDRVFALIVVAVAGLGIAAGGWVAAGAAGTERSAAELGAQRVLTVSAHSRTELLRTVREADPEGRTAMAVVVDELVRPPVLAVDSARLGAVARWRPEYGPVDALPAASRLPAPLPLVTGDRLTLRATASAPAELSVVLQDETSGDPHTVRFRLPGPGDVPVRGCSGGCRLVRFEVAAKRPATVVIRGLGPAGAAELGDITRWRSGGGPALSAEDGVLTVATDDSAPVVRVAGVDAPLPLPIVLAGPAPSGWINTDPSVTSFGDSTAIRLAGHPQALPVVGGFGVLADLDSVRRVTGGTDPGGTMQVWLAPGAPAAVVDRIAARLTVLGDESVPHRAAQLATQGEPAVTGYVLLSAVLVLLTAGAAVAVAGAVDARTLAGTLQTLRVQGLSRAGARRVAYAGPAVLGLSGVLGGLVVAVLADRLAGAAAARFTDDWRVLAPPGPLGWAALGVTVLAGLAVLGTTGWVSARRLRGGYR